MNFEDFENKLNNLPYPKKEDFTIYHVMKKGKIIYHGITLDELKKIYNNENPLSYLSQSHHVIEKDVNEEEFKFCQEQFKKRIKDLYKEFKYYLFSEYEVEGEKAELLFAMCCDRTLDSDFSFIEDLFSDFVDLIK